MAMGLVWRKICPHHGSLQNSYCVASETEKPLAKNLAQFTGMSDWIAGQCRARTMHCTVMD